MKKGFTLIEVLGVLVLLGIIALISIPQVKNLINGSEDDLYNDQINNIKEGLKDWAHDNIFLLPEEDDYILLSLGQIKQAGFLEQKIENPKKNNCFSNSSLLKISKKNNQYDYSIDSLEEVKCSLVLAAPTIKLNGKAVEYIETGFEYIDEGATAFSPTGEDITASMVTSTSGSGTTIDTTIEGQYQIIYSITYNNKTMIAIRNVFVTL